MMELCPRHNSMWLGLFGLIFVLLESCAALSHCFSVSVAMGVFWAVSWMVCGCRWGILFSNIRLGSTLVMRKSALVVAIE